MDNTELDLQDDGLSASQLERQNAFRYGLFCELARDKEFRNAVYSLNGFRYKGH